MKFANHPMPVLRGMASASIGLGFFSLVVFWWYPFSFMLSGAGLIIALFCLLRGVRGLYGENHALIGATLCSISFATILTLTEILHVVMWDH